ncbi:hypothetical protein MAR_011955 [Mya arenaria]|uniref:Uncharacterized protein n=1 Tax=Mya arenaria TaxID=6604 RepID=A0ABY7FZK8_MYAAR|nr:hypothetical protein MAR_011955 [Mya arenaria]
MTDSYLVPRPRTTEMTFWSRYDPVAQPRRSTDHWTKMKQRAIQYRSLDNPDGIGAPMSMVGKYGIGSYKTVLGVGNAPRS